MNKQPYFAWDEENGIASCILTYKSQEFIGIATCHPNDKDMQSEKTGCQIAAGRVRIALLKFKRDNELKPQLEILLHMKSIYNTSSKSNEFSYEYKMLLRQIQRLQNLLAAIKLEISGEEHRLEFFIKNKDEFYKNVRKNRGKAKKE